MDIQPISPGTKALAVRILAFARVRELLGEHEFTVEFSQGATLRELMQALLTRYPAIAPLQSSTRLARNGAIASLDTQLHDGDEIALLPPVGGG